MSAELSQSSYIAELENTVKRFDGTLAKKPAEVRPLRIWGLAFGGIARDLKERNQDAGKQLMLSEHYIKRLIERAEREGSCPNVGESEVVASAIKALECIGKAKGFLAICFFFGLCWMAYHDDDSRRGKERVRIRGRSGRMEELVA